MTDRLALTSFVGFSLIFLSGCALPGGPGGYLSDYSSSEDSEQARIIKTEDAVLSDQLKDYSDLFAVTVMTAADDMTAASDQAAIQKEARLWALRMVPQCNVLAHSTNPRIGLVDLTLLVSNQYQQLHGEIGKAKFGDQIERARQAADTCYEGIWNLVYEVMSAQDAELLREHVDHWLEQNGKEDFLEFQRMVELSRQRNPDGGYKSHAASSGFFRDMNRNISGTAYELNQLNRQIELLNHFAQHSPTYARWSAESLFYDITSEGYKNGPLGKDMDRLNRSLEELASASKELPQEQQETIRALRDETLAEIETVVDRLFLKTIVFVIILLVLIAGFQACMILLRRRLNSPSAPVDH
ncbi:MAG: hypothetical protein AAF571_07960 [Verrucomicrobiota bacterium]